MAGVSKLWVVSLFNPASWRLVQNCPNQIISLLWLHSFDLVLYYLEFHQVAHQWYIDLILQSPGYSLLLLSYSSEPICNSECRVFNKEGITKYFFTEVRSKTVCLVCQETVVVLNTTSTFTFHPSMLITLTTRNKRMDDYGSEDEGKSCAGIQISKDQQAFLWRGVSQRVHGRDSRYLVSWEGEQIWKKKA